MKWVLFAFILNADGVYVTESLGHYATESLCNQVARTVEHPTVCIDTDKSKKVEIWRAE